MSDAAFSYALHAPNAGDEAAQLLLEDTLALVPRDILRSSCLSRCTAQLSAHSSSYQHANTQTQTVDLPTSTGEAATRQPQGSDEADDAQQTAQKMDEYVFKAMTQELGLGLG